MRQFGGGGSDRFRVLAMQLARRSGASALARRLLGGRGCLFIFHRVAPPGSWAELPNRDFHIDADFLGELLDFLIAAGWAVVTLDEAVERLRRGDPGRFVNFSIDDVYRDTAELAVPIFRSRGLPVTLFVTTGIPDGTLCLWQAGLETILSERPAVVLEDGSVAPCDGPETRRQLFARLNAAWEGDDAPQRYARFCAANGYDPATLHDRHAVTWTMLDGLRDDPLVEIGAHTVSHPHLAALPEAAARAEIAGCRARLRERLGLPVRHFAFPFGRRADCGERDFALAREAGFATASTTRKGLVGARDRDRLHALPRNTLNGAHRNVTHAELHLSGLGGVVARGLGAV